MLKLTANYVMKNFEVRVSFMLTLATAVESLVTEPAKSGFNAKHKNAQISKPA